MERPLRLLMVEDVEDDALLTVRELRRQGWAPTFRRVETAAEMEAALSTQPFDVVLSDYSLPQFDALGALGVMHRLGLDVPFIIISGTIGEETAVAAMKAGAHDYLQKGQLRRLAPAIERELREAQSREVRRRAEEELRQSEKQFRSLIDYLPDLLLLVHEGVVGYLNATALRTLGYADAAELTGRPLEVLLHPEERGSPPPRVGDGPREARWVRKDGSLLPVEWAVHPIRLERMPGVVVMARDLTEKKRVQEQLLISDRMASVGVLAAGVAHEINNPLAAVLANLDFSLEVLGQSRASGSGRLSEEVDQALAEAREAGEQVRKIVRDLKLFSRAEEDEAGAPVAVDRVLEFSLRMAANEIRHRARLMKELRDVPPVIANEGRLGQVFLNLIVNAAQAIPEGRSEANEIRVTTAREGDRVIVKIADTGAGIPPEVLRRLFTPFFTTKAVGVGTGLGLSICHRILAAHGGEIRIDSEVGKGTTVTVSLPTASAAQVAESPAPAPSPPAPSNRQAILILDDEPMVAKALKRMLSGEREITICQTTREAIDELEGGAEFDAVLCDLMMPDATGMDFHAAVARLRPALLPRIVFMTGGAFTAAAQSFLSEVRNPRIEKPFDREKVLTALDRALSAPG